MSKYIDSFADATVDTGSMTGTKTSPQAAVGTKKKVKIDASLLQNLDASTSLLLAVGQNAFDKDLNIAPVDSQDTCTQKGCKTCASN